MFPPILKTKPYEGELNGWLKVAHKLSLDSTHPQHKMAAVIVRGGNVLSLAVNSHSWGRHSEVRAISKVDDVRGATVYVMRANRRISKPCKMCGLILKERGISKAIYINKDGEIEEMKIYADQ